MSDNQQQLDLSSVPLTRNISMTRLDEDILVQFQQDLGLRSFSGAFVVQLREWARMTGRLPELLTNAPSNN